MVLNCIIKPSTKNYWYVKFRHSVDFVKSRSTVRAKCPNAKTAMLCFNTILWWSFAVFWLVYFQDYLNKE